MIFATVGTHEDPFDRLIRALEQYAGNHPETVRVQTGYSSVPLHNCEGSPMLGHRALQQGLEEARVVVMHAGPASIHEAWALGKLPIVVPRQKRFGEHVDDHQVRFARRLGNRIICIEDIRELSGVLSRFDDASAHCQPPSTTAREALALSDGLDQVCRRLASGRPRRSLFGWRRR